MLKLRKEKFSQDVENFLPWWGYISIVGHVVILPFESKIIDVMNPALKSKYVLAALTKPIYASSERHARTIITTSLMNICQRKGIEIPKTISYK